MSHGNIGLVVDFYNFLTITEADSLEDESVQLHQEVFNLTEQVSITREEKNKLQRTLEKAGEMYNELDAAHEAQRAQHEDTIRQYEHQIAHLHTELERLKRPQFGSPSDSTDFRRSITGTSLSETRSNTGTPIPPPPTNQHGQTHSADSFQQFDVTPFRQGSPPPPPPTRTISTPVIGRNMSPKTKPLPTFNPPFKNSTSPRKPIPTKPPPQTLPAVLREEQSHDSQDAQHGLRVAIPANMVLDEEDCARLEVIDKDDDAEDSATIEITAEVDEYENSDDGVLSLFCALFHAIFIFFQILPF